MNILLTSVGRRTYMVNYFKHALHGSGFVYASNSIMTYTLTQADGYVITPCIYDDRYIDFLLDYCKKKDISALISLFDIDLPVLSLNKEKFEGNGIKLIVSNYNVTKLCNDKWKTYLFLKSLGLPQVKSFLGLDDVRQSIAKKEIFFPLILKPRWGMGSIGIYEVCNEIELNVLYAKLHNEIFGTYLKYESVIDSDSCIIIQEKIKGQEYGLEVLNDLQGNYVTTFAKKKIAMRAGETDIAETIDASEFIKTSICIATQLKHIGVLDIDCFKTINGDCIILEMNCRFGGQYPFTHNAGVDLPLQIIRWLNGMDTDFKFLTPQLYVRSCKDLCPVVF